MRGGLGGNVAAGDNRTCGKSRKGIGILDRLGKTEGNWKERKARQVIEEVIKSEINILSREQVRKELA